MAPHASTLAWKIPWMKEPGGLLSMGSDRVGHNRSDLAAAAALYICNPQFSIREFDRFQMSLFIFISAWTFDRLCSLTAGSLYLHPVSLLLLTSKTDLYCSIVGCYEPE